MSKKVYIEKEIVEKLYQEHSLKQCGEALNVSAPVIRRLLEEYNIPIKTQRIDIDYDEMIKLYNNNTSIDAIAEYFGVSRSYIATRLKRHGIDTSPQYSHIITTYSGYKMIYSPDHPFCDCKGYVREHRLVMEKCLGRYLKPTEVVHHKNSIRDDNSIENLKLCEGSSEHSKSHIGRINKSINIKELERVANDYTMEELAKKFNTTVDTIRTRLIRFNIQRKKKHVNNNKYHNDKI